MTNQAEYMRRRREAIKAGTWEPHRAADPTLVPTPADWAWAAGFLEGEGSFVDSGTSPRVYAPQKDPEALERLLALFGGSVRQQVNGRVFGEWFRARLFLDMQQYAERDEQGERRKVVHTPQLMFGVRDVVGGAVAVLAEEEVEVDSPEFGRQVWRVTGDPQPIRKKRAVIGGLVTLERVVERGRAGVT
jgi:hypothetical protein